MNCNVFVPKYPISAQFGYNFSRQTNSGAGIAGFCHSLVTSLYGRFDLISSTISPLELHLVDVFGDVSLL